MVPVTKPPIAGGFVRVDAGRITAVGDARALEAGAAEAVVDLGSAALLPGLVNPHTHLELSCYAGQLPPGPFWSWIQGLVRLRAAPGQVERESGAVSEGAWRSLRAGVTCVGDISRRNLAWPVLKSIPIRKVCFVELLSLADHPPRTSDELRAAVAAVQEDDLLTVGISPHAPYSVPGQQIRAAIRLALELGRPWCAHWAETREEVAFVMGRPVELPAMLTRLMEQCGVFSPAKRPIEFLADCAEGSAAGALAHVNYVDDAEMEALAAAGHTVIYCPRAHRFFGHGPHPFPRLRRAGVRLALATDSLASNDSLGVLEELALLKRLAAPPISDQELLKLITIQAAEALGLGRTLGSIEIGRCADLAAFALPAGVADPAAELIERPRQAQAVWVGGKRVV